MSWNVLWLYVLVEDVNMLLYFCSVRIRELVVDGVVNFLFRWFLWYGGVIFYIGEVLVWLFFLQLCCCFMSIGLVIWKCLGF